MPAGTTTAIPTQPPPWRMGRDRRAPGWRSDASTGTMTDAFGRRTVISPPELIEAVSIALHQEVGDAADEILFKIGSAAATSDMHAFIERAVEEFGVELPKVHMGVALQTWWWPWSQAGWGRAAFDLQRAAQRLVRIDVDNSAMARSHPSGRRPACHLLAGLFAGAFGQLSGREVGCAEIQCRAAGAADCRFLVTTRSRATSAAAWLDQDVSADEIERRLTEAAKDRAS